MLVIDMFLVHLWIVSLMRVFALTHRPANQPTLNKWQCSPSWHILAAMVCIRILFAIASNNYVIEIVPASFASFRLTDRIFTRKTLH
jgi:hypothetical protein